MVLGVSSWLLQAYAVSVPVGGKTDRKPCDMCPPRAEAPTKASLKLRSTTTLNHSTHGYQSCFNVMMMKCTGPDKDVSQPNSKDSNSPHSVLLAEKTRLRLSGPRLL